MMQEHYRYVYGENPAAGVIYLHPEQIRTPKGGRKEGQDRNAIIRISESIKRYGILQPLSVRLVGDMAGFPAYELLDGGRRLRAARLLGLEKVPCTVVSGDERSAAIAPVIENLRQKRLNIFEQAASFRLLTEDYHLTQEEIARKVGVSQSAIANKLRLLRLSQEEQRRIMGAGLTERHARALLRLKDPQKRAFALDEIIGRALTVADAEALIEAVLEAEKGTQGRENGAFKAEKTDFGRGEGAVSRETIHFLPSDGQNVPRETVPFGIARADRAAASCEATQLDGRFTDEVSRETAPLNGRSDGTVSRETVPFGSEGAEFHAEIEQGRSGSVNTDSVSDARAPVISTVMAPETPPRGVCPRKFALQDLRPLYNSIERTLSIFRKTGQAVECRREESADGVRIIIDIPRRA